MHDQVTVTVRLFASLAERAGARVITLRLPAATPVGAVWAHLPDPVRGSAPPPEGLRWAINREWAAPGAPLADGDEVAVLTPVSGG